MQQIQSSNSFLDKFTAEVIENYYKLYLEKPGILAVQPKELAKMPAPQFKIPQILRMQLPQIPSPALKPMLPLASQIPSAIQHPQLTQLSFNIPSGEAGKTGIDKLNLLINDQSVERIEYRAENQPLLVTRLGQTFQTKIILTGQEAMELLEEFSKQARIPLMKGVFRAYLRNFMVFAVVSDFIKPRFIIQKTRAF